MQLHPYIKYHHCCVFIIRLIACSNHYHVLATTLMSYLISVQHNVITQILHQSLAAAVDV